MIRQKNALRYFFFFFAIPRDSSPERHARAGAGFSPEKSHLDLQLATPPKSDAGKTDPGPFRIIL